MSALLFPAEVLQSGNRFRLRKESLPVLDELCLVFHVVLEVLDEHLLEVIDATLIETIHLHFDHPGDFVERILTSFDFCLPLDDFRFGLLCLVLSVAEPVK